MKLRKIFSFECAYQLRRPWPWLSMAVLGIFAFLTTRIGILPVTLPQDFILNSPFIITSVTMLSCQIWLLVAPAVAGETAARDVATRIHPLMYTNPVSKAKYLGGRFLAALVINALILLGVQAGSLLAVYAPGLNPDIIGPFRPVAYLAAYGLIALPNALIATAFQFSVALSSGRPMASYAGSLLLFFLTYPVTMVLYMSGLGERALLVDPIGVMAIMNEMMSDWTLVEKNVRLFALEGAMLHNRLLWIGIALGTLAFIYLRFGFAHRTEAHLWRRLTRRWSRKKPVPGTLPPRGAIFVPSARRSFGWWTRAQQTLAIAGSSFRAIATSPVGIFLLVVFPMFAVVVLLTKSEHWGIPLLPRTGYILSKYLTAPLTLFTDFRVIVPLLIVYFAGELVWRERDAGLSENVDATPVSDGVLFLGKLVGLGMVLATLMVSLTAAGVISQALLNYHAYEPGQYLLVLFGFQLPEYLLFSVLALLLHTVADQKYVAMLAALVAYLFIVFASFFGIGHNLLVYGSSPAWYFTDMRGFGPTVGPWLWFKSYWAAWALLLAVMARLFWVRGVKQDLRTRLRIAQHRFTRTTLAVALAGLTLVLTLGGFIFYNTNVLNEYITEDQLVQRRADYERQYGKFEGIPQPVRTATKLYIEIYPDRRTATIRGSYRLVNRSGAPIDSVHLEPAFYVKTRMTFDQPSRLVVADDQLGHYIYALDNPLQTRRLADTPLCLGVQAERLYQRRFTQQRGRHWGRRKWHLPCQRGTPGDRLPADA